MTNKLYSCDGTHGMSYWATSPLIRPRNYQYHHHNEGHCAREDYCFMDDPKYEQPEYAALRWMRDRKSTRLNSSHGYISYAVFCLKKKNRRRPHVPRDS